MPDYTPVDLPDDPKLARNIVHFARALRRAGLSVGPGRVVDAIRAVAAAGFSEREDFYHTLAACFISRPEQRTVFAQVFRLYWRDPRFMEQMMSLVLPTVRGMSDEREAEAAEKRAAEALLDGHGPEPPQPDPADDEVEVSIDASQTASGEERLHTLDFEQMSVAEAAAARRILSRLELPVTPILTRRTIPDRRGAQADWRRTLAKAARRGGELRLPERRRRADRLPALVVLCDISGSMSRYSRAVLHFVHGVANARGQGWAAVHAFTFGTRLTNISRHMGQRDVDAALAAAGAEAQDWDGGTRIGECLRTFNRDWSRRVMGQGAVVILVTDGLERGDPDLLGQAMERLALSARQVIWVNPLLRWRDFAPRAAGVRAILPHVSSVRTGHNIAALEGLAAALSRPGDSGEKDRLIRGLRSEAADRQGVSGLSSSGDIGARLSASGRAGGATGL